MQEERSWAAELIDQAKRERNAWRTATFILAGALVIVAGTLAVVMLM